MDITLYIQLGILVLAVAGFAVGKASAEPAATLGVLTPAHLAYLLKGYLQFRDLTALIPYWMRQGLIETTLTPEGAPICVKKAEPADSAPCGERTLFHAVFAAGDSFSPYYVDENLKGCLRKGKSAIEADCDTEKNLVFTKASKRSKLLIGFLSYISVAAAIFNVMLYFQSDAIEIWGKLLAAVGVSCLGLMPMHRLINRIAKIRQQGGVSVLLPVLGMCLLFVAGAGVALFTTVYMPEKAAATWAMAANYIVLSILYLLALKRTAAAQRVYEETQTTELLDAEVGRLALNDGDKNSLLQALKIAQQAWNEAEKVRVREHPHPDY
jgi:hypothetical protein